jgi:hypothetical protein
MFKVLQVNKGGEICERMIPWHWFEQVGVFQNFKIQEQEYLNR